MFFRVPLPSFSIFLFLLISSVQAETIILKNGNSIQCLEVQDQGDTIRCMVSANMSTALSKESILKIEQDKSVSKSPAPFKFDMWESGISLDAAINAAERHNLPLRKSGIIHLGKHFDSAVRRDAKSARDFSYWANYLNEKCVITLSFTPKSRLLHLVSITWTGIPPNNREDLLSDLMAIMTEQYGQPRVGFRLIGGIRTWQPNKNQIVTLRTSSTSLKLNYLDKTIDHLRKEELAGIRDKEKQTNIRKGKIIF